MPLFRDEEYLRVDFEEEKEKDEALWVKCKSCEKLIFKKKLKENNHVCPNCNAYFFLTAKERIKTLVDEETFSDKTKRIESDDPLDFVDTQPYKEKVKENQTETGMFDAIIVGTGEIEEVPLVLGVMDFRFIGGSMGSVVGEQIVSGIERAVDEDLPFVLVSSSGGARMQEGILSLFQMVKTTSARDLLSEAGLPFISVMTYPTTAGVEASIASLGDVTIAERGALIGFAGRRVIEETIGEDLPQDFQSSRFAMEHGIVDSVVERESMRNELATILGFFN
ncbi:acetyl-CoA carboxylase, carboxyltransferase subunit beta [Candidatus Bipolaricaulota bacterium]|nr:acetyl-CoA carboxylase, carboxyltransferase subunit beta [Candidatus Bipolaricaulota bacterium]